MCGCDSSQTQQNIYFKAGRRITCPAGKSRKRFLEEWKWGTEKEMIVQVMMFQLDHA